MFEPIYERLLMQMRDAPVVQMKSWQSTDANPQALMMRELLHVQFDYNIPDSQEQLNEEVQPFQPWAEKHFLTERVSGHPINPGETYKEWRYPASADQHTEDFEFSHSYAERYWPQYAGYGGGGELDVMEIMEKKIQPHRGIRYSYGDLSTLLTLLASDITTRQAYLPIFFPEDLMAARLKKRIPCTLGYHFICRDGKLDVVYPMRSCDFVRHFRDDVYLTARLAQFVLEQIKLLRLPDDPWQAVVPGKLNMVITSLHCFAADTL